MQSDFAKALMEEHQIKNVGVDTFLLVKNDGECLVFSSAALAIAKELIGFWYLFGVFKYMPTRVRDFVYRTFAKKRYTLFGKKEACMVPSPDVRSRFIGI
jgi:predicted DCC family thiol-disulfide oxidoreductase YuxK